MLQQRDLLGRFEVRQTFRLLRNFLLHLGMNCRHRQQLRARRPHDVARRGPLLELIPVRHDQYDRELALVADHHRLRDILVRPELVLDRLWRDVLAARRNDDVLLAIGDAQKSVLQFTDVTGVKPARFVDVLFRCDVVVVVALHDVRPARKYLAVACNHHFDSGNRTTDSTDTEMFERVRRNHRRRFRQSVSLENDQPRRIKELRNLGRKRRTTGNKESKVSASALLQLRKDKLLRDAVLPGQQPRRLAASKLHVRPPLANILGPEENPLLEATTADRVLHHARINLFVQPRHRHHHCRLHFTHVHRHGIDRLGVHDLHAVREQVVVTHPLEDVTQRQKAERRIRWAYRHRVHGRDAIRMQVVLRQHHALRISRRTRGVNQRDQLLRAHCQCVTFELFRACGRVVLRAKRFDVGEGEITPIALGRRESDDPLQPRHFITHRSNLFRLRRRRHKDCARAGVVEQIRNLFRWQRRIDRNIRHRRTETCIIGDDPLGAVLRKNRDAVLRLNAKSRKPECRTTNALEQRLV